MGQTIIIGPVRVSIYYSHWPGYARCRRVRLGDLLLLFGLPWKGQFILYFVSNLLIHWADNSSVYLIGWYGRRSMVPSLLLVPPDRVPMSHGSRGGASSTRAEVPGLDNSSASNYNNERLPLRSSREHRGIGNQQYLVVSQSLGRWNVVTLNRRSHWLVRSFRGDALVAHGIVFIHVQWGNWMQWVADRFVVGPYDQNCGDAQNELLTGS